MANAIKSFREITQSQDCDFLLVHIIIYIIIHHIELCRQQLGFLHISFPACIVLADQCYVDHILVLLE